MPRKGYHYFALINGTPSDSQKLRHYVNMLFFKEKDAEKKKEKEEFEKLNREKENEKNKINE